MSVNKEIYLIQGLPQETYEEFSERVLELAKSLPDKEDDLSVKLVYTKAAPPKLSIIPFKKKKIAAISAYKAKEAPKTELSIIDGLIGMYSVEEAIPVAYNKEWNDMEHTPGVCLFTIFKKKKDVSYETFLDLWHNSHTPLSLKIHPLWNYNRNVVLDQLNEISANWDGIVEEQFKTKSDLLNPVKFFGHPLIMPYRMWQVYSDTKRFLDYPTIEPFYAVEKYIKS